MSLSPAAWGRAREGLRPDAARVLEVAREESAALGTHRVATSARDLAARVLGAGPLDGWLADPSVTDVAVNGDGRVWVDRGRGMECVGARLEIEEVRALAVRLAGAAGRRLDEASPWVDGQLPDGGRLHAVLPPLVADGPHITIRVPARSHPSLADLAASGMFPPSWVRLLSALVERRRAFVVSGGTGAGKTTLLAALLGCVAPTDRVVLVEDVRELHVAHPHVVRLEARQANVEGFGEVSLTVLLRQALRMRPDRIVVGEVRGGEVRELLAALNTGHEGGCGTVHANAPEDVVARFEALGALVGLSPAAVGVQLAAAVEVVLHVSRTSGVRRLESIAVVDRMGEAPVVVTAARWLGGRVERGPAWDRLRELVGRPALDGCDGRVAPPGGAA
ncbi:MAG TPA: TadA family conjugal transfer-associated ATPase [Intrasporangium sp.]|uniref:TadA family conjugal transfer-associated ATPase n=1 Tax=Intrasporangium sp. TaxID=1925024 RepID=UPI002D787A5F|nr:TadA family conjugal transfer-associated ATPase [Intrasporangium sp.]HET7398702.1 TadA family conjugal transfer-associated ATPase [Intrasporangium sp.]